MTDEFIPTLSHAIERDVDLLLVEEFHASLSFGTWLTTWLAWPTSIAKTTVLHSKRRTRSRREIDIFVEFLDMNGEISAVLIENKIDATEQPDQAESYLEEVETLRSSYSAIAAVIVCPKAYAVQHSEFASKFNAVVHYEDIVAYFRAASEAKGEVTSELALRYGFRADLIEQAVFKYRRGYNPILNFQLGDFKASYVAVLNEITPATRPGKSLLQPSAPDGSRSMLFDVSATFGSLPADVRPSRFSHELGSERPGKTNYVAVTFAGWGGALPALRERLEQDTGDLGATFSSKTPNKKHPRPGLVMAVPVEIVDHLGSFEEQLDVIIAGMRKVEMLRGWMHCNTEILLDWKELIDEMEIL